MDQLTTCYSPKIKRSEAALSKQTCDETVGYLGRYHYYYNGGLPETFRNKKEVKGRSSPAASAFFMGENYETFKREW